MCSGVLLRGWRIHRPGSMLWHSPSLPRNPESLGLWLSRPEKKSHFILGHTKRPEEKYFEWVPLLNSELDPFPREREKERVGIHCETFQSNFSLFMEVVEYA